MGRANNNLLITWDKEPDLAKLAGVCEFYFEWGYKEAIIKRFRTVIWHSIVLRILRRAVLDQDQGKLRKNIPTTPKKKAASSRTPCGTPSKMITKHFSSIGINSPVKLYISGSESDEEEEEEQRLIIKIHACRQHTSTDGLPEYRLEIAPKQLVQLTESGIKGLRTPEGPDEWASDGVEGDGDGGKKDKKIPIDPESHLRLWMPACMVKLVEPHLVDNFEGQQERKRLKKATKGTRNTSKGKAPTPTKKKDEAQDVFSAPKKLNTEPMTTKPAPSWSLPRLGDESGTESEGLPNLTIPSTRLERLGQKQTRRQLPPKGDSYKSEFLLRRGMGNISASEGSQTGSGKRPDVKDFSLTPVKPRTGIRDLTKNKKLASTTTTQVDMKSFFPVTQSSSNITKKPTPRGAKVPPSPSKRKSPVLSGESDRGEFSKRTPRKKTDESGRSRTISPSPSMPIVKKSVKVIEISSDSDSEERSMTPLRPLLRARARALTSRHSLMKTNLKLHNEGKPKISSDIIDLT
jgi:Holliday junction resolvase YEN1